MQKSYCDFLNEMSPDELYEGLLAYGFLADKLPPVFTSVPFFNYCKNNKVKFSKKREEYIVYHTMRNVGVPRIMGIPSPMGYQKLCSEIVNDWDYIKKHFRKQTSGQAYLMSRIHIRKQTKSKQIFKMNYSDWKTDGNPESDLLIHSNSISRYLVKADISTCFSSIYTHSIPWAVVGKTEAKKQSNNYSYWYNRIDDSCQSLKYGETHGLLIGPHTSNLLAEIILTVVDKNMYDKGYRYIRHIDDFDCYVNSYEQAQIFLGELENELRKFDLPLNHKKTKIIPLPIEFDKQWKRKLRDLPSFGKSGLVEYPDASSFIDIVLNLSAEVNDYAVLNYAIKKLASQNLSSNAKKLAAQRFMHIAAIYPYLLHLIEEYVFNPYGVSKDKIKILADTIYQDAKKINNYESIGYAVYFAIKYDFELDELDIDYVIKKQDCIILILTWLYYLKVNHWKMDATNVKPFKRKAKELSETSMGRYWLFCYEVLSAANLTGEWRSLKEAGVSFIRDEFKPKDT